MAAQLKAEIAVIDKATKELANIGAGFNGLQNKLVKFTQVATGVFAGGAIVQGIKNIAQASIDFGDSISEQSSKLGMSTDSVQKWAYVAGQSKTSLDEMAKGFGILGKLAFENSPKLEILGVKTRDFNGGLLESGDLLLNTITQLSKIPNVTERNAIAMGIFGKSYQSMTGIMSQSPEQLQKLIKETSKYGLILSNEAVQKLDDAKDAQERMNTSMKVLSATTTSVFAPAIIQGANALSSFFAVFKERSNEENLDKLEQEQKRIQKLISDAETKQFSKDHTSYFGQLINGTTQDAEAYKKSLSEQLRKIDDEIYTTRNKISSSKKITSPTIFNSEDFNETKTKKDPIDSWEKTSQEMEKNRIENEQKQVEWQTKKDDEEIKRLDEQIDRKWQAEKSASDAGLKIWEDDYQKRLQIAEKNKQIENGYVYAAQETQAAMFNIARVGIENTRANMQEKKNMMTVLAIMEGASSVVTAVRSGWESGGGNYYLGAALAIAGGVLAASQTVAQIATIQGSNFAYGGIVPGNSYSGDKVPINVNSAEMVLNRSQQAQLFNMANGKGQGSNTSNVTVHIHDNSGSIVETFKTELRRGSFDSTLSYLNRKLAAA